MPGPVVFANVFDVLHRGHVSYLANARAVGGSLVVALNTDASAKRLGKGDDRPVNNEEDRAIVIAALESVSLVTWFDEDTPVQLLSELKPQVYVKGGDYDMRKLAETALVEGYGGRALAISVRGWVFHGVVVWWRGSRAGDRAWWDALAQPPHETAMTLAGRVGCA